MNRGEIMAATCKIQEVPGRKQNKLRETEIRKINWTEKNREYITGKK